MFFVAFESISTWAWAFSFAIQFAKYSMTDNVVDVYFVVSVLGAALWRIKDRKGKNWYNRLLWLRSAFTLALPMQFSSGIFVSFRFNTANSASKCIANLNHEISTMFTKLSANAVGDSKLGCAFTHWTDTDSRIFRAQWKHTMENKHAFQKQLLIASLSKKNCHLFYFYVC